MSRPAIPISERAVTLRLASMNDAELLLRWRNDPQTRAASLNAAEVSKSVHIAWLERSLLNPDRQIHIAMVDGKDIGTVRSDMRDGVCELSWTIAPEARGRGLAAKMVGLLAEQINGPLMAQVKTGNIASARIAEAAGMIFDHEFDNISYYRRPAQVP